MKKLFYFQYLFDISTQLWYKYPCAKLQIGV